MTDTILVATSNAGKLRDFVAAAEALGVRIAGLPGFAGFPEVVEDGTTFEANARKKAERYSLHASPQMVIADDSGLVVDALGGAPGIHSARYAARSGGEGHSDAANNLTLLRELAEHSGLPRSARFVCVIAAARDGLPLATFRGEVKGEILTSPHGSHGFGYDPLFFFPALNKTFAELGVAEKSKYSHRGTAFRKFLEWVRSGKP